MGALAQAGHDVGGDGVGRGGHGPVVHVRRHRGAHETGPDHHHRGAAAGQAVPQTVARLLVVRRGLPGVLAASANYAASTVAADLLYDADVAGFLRSQGLAPEPEEVREQDTEVRDLTVRTVVAIVLAAAVITLSMLHLGSPWLWLALTIPVQLWAGWPFHVGFLRSIRHARADMNTLISLGTNVAFFASPFVAMPYYDTAATIIAIVLLGRLLEKRARRGTRRAVEALLELAPREDLRPGDERLIKPGEDRKSVV